MDILVLKDEMDRGSNQRTGANKRAGRSRLLKGMSSKDSD